MVEPRFEADAATPEARRALHEQNRLSWNAATRAHHSHKADQAKFYLEGGDKLYQEEAALLGEFTGKSVVHLQCNSGQDTLSMKRLGAETLPGIDISDEAISFARRLSADSGIEASFLRADVYDWLASAASGAERWDVVFCSYGAVIWLSDLATWPSGLALEHFREYDYCNGFRPYREMKDFGSRRWTVPDGKPGIPFMYSLVARKPG